jgi:hypothetical protein
LDTYGQAGGSKTATGLILTMRPVSLNWEFLIRVAQTAVTP